MSIHKDRWTKLSRGYVTNIVSSEPGPGVWVRSTRYRDQYGGQHTLEQYSVDSTTMSSTHCYCGQDRHLAFQRAKKASLDFDRQRRQDAKQDRLNNCCCTPTHHFPGGPNNGCCCGHFKAAL